MRQCIDDVVQLCRVCGVSCCNRRSLGNHVARSHKELGGLRGYTVKYLFAGIVPKCECGCDNDVLWHKTAYKFNTYLSGHNVSGFRVKQPEFTQEQIDNRNNSIRKTYAGPKGDSIRIAIGCKSSATMTRRKAAGFDPSEFFVDKWQDDDFVEKQHVARIKSWEGDAGNLRREKVFTPEFCRKISEANMRRDVRRTSQAEQHFVELLRVNFPDAETSKWFNFHEKTWCADVWIASLGAIIAFDGVYWHGLNFDTEFDLKQIKSITNDIAKNSLARTKKLTLLRIAENVDISQARTLDDLIELAYHVVVEGHVVKEGTFRLQEQQCLITRNKLLCSDKFYVEKELLPIVVDFFMTYVAYHGWFYPVTDVTLEKAIICLARCTGKNDKVSTSFLKSFVHSYWDVGPVKFSNDIVTWERVLRYRLGLNNSKPYTYTLDNGTIVTAQETFDINIKNVRFGFVVQRMGVSWFSPAIATILYKQHLTNISAPVVWDPSIGFSARLLGFASIFNTGKYIGTDPATLMFNDACALRDELLTLRPRLSIELHHCGSELYQPLSSSLDFVFTSPPFFDTEKYVDEPGQCWRDFPVLEKWVNGYLVPTLQNAIVGLKTGCCCVINISDKFADIVKKAALSVGFVRRADLDISVKLRPNHFARKKGHTNNRTEQHLTFQKCNVYTTP
jgi:hypothetical protein